MSKIYYWPDTGQMCRWWCGLGAAVDYAIATEGAEVKLSELAVGIGPFVVGPAVERKIGTSAFSHWLLMLQCGVMQIGPGEKDCMQNCIRPQSKWMNLSGGYRIHWFIPARKPWLK